jgi:hypothetical protein
LEDHVTTADRSDDDGDPLRLLLEVLALQTDVLYAYLERIYEEAYIETAGGPGELRPGVGYVLRTHDDGSMTVEFGDGAHGRRPPNGASSMTVTYRRGTGNVSIELSATTPRPWPPER